MNGDVAIAIAVWVMCALMYAARAGVNLERRRRRQTGRQQHG